MRRVLVVLLSILLLTGCAATQPSCCRGNIYIGNKCIAEDVVLVEEGKGNVVYTDQDGSRRRVISNELEIQIKQNHE